LHTGAKYLIVQADMLPEVFLKVVRAKEMLERGEAATVAEAVSLAGISRSAFYKYKDAVSFFHDMKRGRIITLHVILRDRTGSLSTLLKVFAEASVNILTINQSIPINGTGVVTITAEMANTLLNNEELLSRIEEIPEVIKVEVLAG
jgi:ACT domain-containing protein